MAAEMESVEPGGDPDDAALIERSLSEPEAFTAIYDRHSREIFRYAARRLGHGVAEEVMGDTFLAAFGRRRSFDRTRSEALPWLYGIASNLIGRHRRQEARAYRALARTGVDPFAESDTDRVEAQMVARGAERELVAGLARLAARDRDVVLLVAWAELSYEQVADALGLPVGTVRSRLNRARRKLREALGGADPRIVAEEPNHG